MSPGSSAPRRPPPGRGQAARRLHRESSRRRMRKFNRGSGLWLRRLLWGLVRLVDVLIERRPSDAAREVANLVHGMLALPVELHGQRPLLVVQLLGPGA